MLAVPVLPTSGDHQPVLSSSLDVMEAESAGEELAGVLDSPGGGRNASARSARPEGAGKPADVRIVVDRAPPKGHQL